MVMGGVVPVVNIDGIAPGQMKLTGKLLADIYLGKISKWNDPQIAGANQGLKLPDQAITVIHRSMAPAPRSFLPIISPRSAGNERQGRQCSFGVMAGPEQLGGKGKRRCRLVRAPDQGGGRLCRYAYAKQNKMTYTLLQKQGRDFVSPNDKSFQAAAPVPTEECSGFYENSHRRAGQKQLADHRGDFHPDAQNSADAAKAKEVLKFFDWAYQNATRWALSSITSPCPMMS